MTFETTSERRQALIEWVGTQELATQAQWARMIGLSATAARKDFIAISDHLQPVRQGTKVCGYRLIEEVAA